MNVKNIILSSILAVGCVTASAQQEAKTVVEFNPHWSVRAQVGVQETLGEVDWTDLLSPTAQVALGYDFTELFGARLNLNAWQSKAGTELSTGETYKWKWNYFAPTVNLTFDVTNAIWGYNHNRLVDLSIYAGIGANFRFSNGEAQDVNDAFNRKLGLKDNDMLQYLWDGSKASFLAQWGLNLDFRINDKVSVGLESQYNTLSDRYNSKKAGNSDWYFNTMVGVKVNLGQCHKTRTLVAPVEEPAPVVEPVVEPAPAPAPAPIVEEKREPLRRDIFFTLRGSEVSAAEMSKVEDIANYLNKYPEAKVTITGYADKGTGNPKINVTYARKRSQKVADILTQKFGISADRITVDSKGDTVQPFEKNDLNRVSICIAE